MAPDVEYKLLSIDAKVEKDQFKVLEMGALNDTGRFISQVLQSDMCIRIKKVMECYPEPRIGN